MKALRAIASELFGLFIEDGAFAAAIGLWLSACGGLAYVHGAPPHTRALALFAGLAIILIASVARGARTP